MTIKLSLLVGVLLPVSLSAAVIGAPPWRPGPAGGQDPAKPAAQQAPPLFKSGTDVVAVDVTVVDGTGRPARGLETRDFQVTVDGRPRRIASLQFVSQETAPGTPMPTEPPLPAFSSNKGVTGGRLVLVVVDQDSLGVGSGKLVMDAVGQFLSRLGPGDRAALAVLPGGFVVTFTRHLALVRDAVGRVMGTNTPIGKGRRLGLTEAFGIERNDTLILTEVASRECAGQTGADGSPLTSGCMDQIRVEARSIVRSAQNDASVALTGLRSLVGRLNGMEGQKTLVLISGGLVIDRDVASLGWVAGDTSSARTTIHALRLIPPTIDVHDTRENYSAVFDHDLAATGLETLVGKGGGLTFNVVGSGAYFFDRLSLEMSAYYLIAFEPEPGDRDGKTHKISVKVTRPGLTVRSRPEFTVPPASAAPPSDDEIIKSLLRQPLLAGDIPISVVTQSFKDPQSEKIKLIVAASIGRPQDVSLPRSLGFQVANERGDVEALTVETSPAATGRYTGAALINPGTYTLKLAVIDDQGRRGSVEHRFDARLRAGGPFRFGSLMLVDGRMGGAMSPKIEPRVSGSSALGYTEVYAVDAARFEGATLAFEVASEPNGKTLAQAAGTLSDTGTPGRRLAAGEVPVAGLEPGEYVLRVVVSVAGRPVARLTQPFTLVGATAR
jgi:VWFA-related protein